MFPPMPPAPTASRVAACRLISMPNDMSATPYDQLPYRCQPIEWTAPERLTLASLLHGGPTPDLRHYRVLELGCGDGSNLLPMAYYRPQATFIGVDNATTQIQIANTRSQQLGLDNTQWLTLDFRQADAHLEGHFDFIIAHGVFSWVPDGVRDALFHLCQQRLADNGLLYLNYNTKPGWNIRGMVRDYLLANTAHLNSLQQKAEQAQYAARRMAHSLTHAQDNASQQRETHPFPALLANEFQFVCDNHPSYVAHEYLAEYNKAYWRSEFLELAARHGLLPVVDADYNYPSGRIDPSLPRFLDTQDLIGGDLNDTVDLLSYRQLHTPILSKHRIRATTPNPNQLQTLRVASCLHPVGPHRPNWYQHPNGFQVEAKSEHMAVTLNRLFQLWPHSAPFDTLTDHNPHFMEDLILLHNNGLVELRLPGSPSPSGEHRLNPLNQLELQWGNYTTTANHQRIEGHAPQRTAGQH